MRNYFLGVFALIFLCLTSCSTEDVMLDTQEHAAEERRVVTIVEDVIKGCAWSYEIGWQCGAATEVPALNLKWATDGCSTVCFGVIENTTNCQPQWSVMLGSCSPGDIIVYDEGEVTVSNLGDNCYVAVCTCPATGEVIAGPFSFNPTKTNISCDGPDNC